MPLITLKKVWGYCSYSMPFFIFVLVLIFTVETIRNLIWGYWDSNDMVRASIGIVLVSVISLFLSGYGMSITRDRINHGHRLPKIMLDEVFYLAIKSIFVYGGYLILQFLILKFTSMVFDFPMFNLEELLLDFRDTIHMFAVNEPLHSLKFIVIGGLVFYFTTFFVEIGLARLADTKSILSAFNIYSLYKSIKLFGFRRYIVDCTSIILIIIILTYVKSIQLPYFWIDQLWSTFFGFLIFATQFLGIGALYCEIKDKAIELGCYTGQ